MENEAKARGVSSGTPSGDIWSPGVVIPDEEPRTLDDAVDRFREAMIRYRSCSETETVVRKKRRVPIAGA